MKLSKENLKHIKAEGIDKPSEDCLHLPVKVLQFGTGVLLRGLPDYFIDKANKQGVFNGRIVVVKSTSKGGTDDFTTQDALYTHYIRGIEDGRRKEKTIINASISHVLNATNQWDEIISLASNSSLEVVISNTTEVGLTLSQDDRLNGKVPKSYPAKLTAFLYARYKAFNGAEDKGLVIVPTELIPDNGIILRDACLDFSSNNSLEESFILWLRDANDFCNSLVDRIVPGTLPSDEVVVEENKQGYTDSLHISSETYRLWVIETKKEKTKNILSFASADEGVIVTDNIQKFRDLKLRLLNGAHTFICGLAVLSGFANVKEAMANSFFATFITSLLHQEIVPTLVRADISKKEAEDFANKVLDRFRNPFIEHLWLNICVQYTSKIKMRCVPSLLDYFKLKKEVPQHMATGFGAYILFMRTQLNDNGQYVGRAWGTSFIIQDDKAAVLYKYWQAESLEKTVHGILGDLSLWGSDLTLLRGFESAVASTVRNLLGQTGGIELQSSTILAA